MAASPVWTMRRVAVFVCAGLVLVAGSGFLIWQRATGSSAQPSCRIEFLGLEERVRRQNADIDELELTAPRSKYRRCTVADADNPVLFPSHCAVVRVENTTDHPFTLYRLRMEFNRDLATYHAFLVQMEVRAPDEDDLPKPAGSDGLFADRADRPILPTVDLLQRIKAPTVTVRPGEAVEVPITSILSGRRARAGGLRPATYTVCATLYYVEAPDGEARQITSPPVEVTVTQDHINAAEDFWKHFRQ